MDEKKYTEDGYAIVSETDKCPLWEKDTVPCRSGYTKACFFCRFTDFRSEETIRRAEKMPRGEPLHSVCRNKKNKRNGNERNE